MNNEPAPRDDQNLWNLIFFFFFILVGFFLLGILVNVYHGRVPTRIHPFDLLLIVLATFRLIRLFVYDKVTRFIRDWFVEVRETHSEQGVAYVTRRERARGPLRTCSELLACPWCFGLWCSLLVTFFYFLTPLAWLPILILAIAGVATLLQLAANKIGWSAEYRKLKAQKLQEGKDD